MRVDFLQWFAQVKWSELGFAALVWVVVLGSGHFINTRLWPFISREWWPTRAKMAQARLEAESKQEQERNQAMQNIGNALIELRVLSGQTLQEVQEHNTWTRNYFSQQLGYDLAKKEKM